MEQGWVKFFRSIVDWEWYGDPNTFRMFFHLIVTANHETRLWKGRTIKRGQRLTTIRKLADELSIDEKTVQRCLHNLESTKEIKVEPSKSGTLITVRKYGDYQSDDSKVVGTIPTPTPTQAPTPTPTQAPTKQEYKNERMKEDSTPLPPRGENGVGVGFEVYGKFGNVQLKPMELRHLYETYGEKLTKDAIEDLSCHLADGTQQSVRHYATLELWLKHRSLKQRGGDASYKGDSTIGTEFTRKM